MTDVKTTLTERSIDGLKSISSEISEYTKQRFSHPLFLSFIISFVFYNWRPISIFIFSDQSIENVIKFIKAYDNVGALLWPSLSAIIYTIGFPFLRNWLASSVNYATKEAHRLQHNETMRVASYRIKEAEKEYEIAVKRSGTQELSSLQSAIDELTQINEALISSSQTAVQENERLMKIVSETNSQVEALTEEKSTRHFIDQIQRAINAYSVEKDISPIDAEDLAIIGKMTKSEIKTIMDERSDSDVTFGETFRLNMRNALINFDYLQQIITQSGVQYRYTNRINSLRKNINKNLLAK